MKILLQNVKHLTLRHISNGINIFQKTKKKRKEKWTERTKYDLLVSLHGLKCI